MKKTLLAVYLWATSLITFAQNDKTVSLGIKGGVNLSKIQYSQNDVNRDMDFLAAFNYGAFVDFKVSNSLSIQPAFLFTGKGYGQKIEENSFFLNAKARIYYLQVPVNLLYHAPVGNNEFYIGAGPYAGYAISGQVKGSIQFEDEKPQTFDGQILFGNGQNEQKRFDYGVTALAGFKFRNGFLVNLNYDWGLADLSSANSEKIRNRVLGVSVGYSLPSASTKTGTQSNSTFGIRGGLNLAKLQTDVSSSNTSVSTGTLVTFSAGVFGDFVLANSFSVQPAINFTGAGGRKTQGNFSLKPSLFYIQIPLDLVYNVPVSAGKFYFGAGPFAAFGVSAKLKERNGIQSETTNVGFGNDPSQYRSTYMGANAIAGFQFKSGFLLHANYDMGLTSMSNFGDGTVTTRTFGLSVGYAF